jgi:hypothetical protein
MSSLLDRPGLGRKKSRFAAAFLFSAGITYRLALEQRLARQERLELLELLQELHQQERLQVLGQRLVLALVLLLLFCHKQLK